MGGMERTEAGDILRDVVITRARTDVPADVVEAIDVLVRLIGEQGADLAALTGDDPVAAVEVAERRRAKRATALAQWAAQGAE
jgi:hypothetical protein